MNFRNPDPSVLSEKKLYIFDMDGTIYLGFDVFPYAIRFIKNLRKNGKKVMFFTNNASHTTEYYVQKLTNKATKHLLYLMISAVVIRY